MPWVRRSHGSRRFYWDTRRHRCAVTAAFSWVISGGVIAPHSSRSFEQQLGQSPAQVRRLEKRVRALEAKLGTVEDAAEPASTAKLTNSALSFLHANS